MAKMDRNDTNTKRTLTNYRNQLQGFSIRADEALATRDYKEVTLAHTNGKHLAKEVSAYIIRNARDEHSELCDQIKTAYANLQEIYKTSEEIRAGEVDKTDNDLEDLLGGSD